MKVKYFKKATFWAREFRLPLFWLMDKKHRIFRKSTLLLYKNSIIHAYHLDDLEIKAAQSGYKYFIKKDNVEEYAKQIDNVLALLKKVSIDYKDIKVNKLSVAELKKRFFNIIKILCIYSNVYTKTEPFFLTKIEANEVKYKKLIKKLGEWRFKLRKEGEPVFYTLIGVLLKEIAKRFDLKTKELFFYTNKEILMLFKGQKVKRDIIEKRQKGYALISLKNKKVLLTGEYFKRMYRELVVLKLKTRQLTGQVAMRGKAKGRVRAILHNKRVITKDVAKFKKGEILVTEMTRPDTILACKKAAAIVTDEGGITSHAAIISRELKTPCVIATKVATQVLKDGDLVEVDAYKGIVKILKRKK
ncbi:MAG: PEP-utilizing enzyme [bacterium]